MYLVFCCNDDTYLKRLITVLVWSKKKNQNTLSIFCVRGKNAMGAVGLQVEWRLQCLSAALLGQGSHGLIGGS